MTTCTPGVTLSWLGLVLDVVGDDPVMAGRQVGEFWAQTLGADYRPAPQDEHPGDPGDVVGPAGGELALCHVTETKTVKNRVHLDVRSEGVATLEALGARVSHERPRWTEMVDPQGNELCAFVRDATPAYRLMEVVVDAVTPEAIARWWAARFGVEVRNDGEPWWWLEGVPGAAFDALVFQPVPEPKTVKNRIHWDVRGEVPDLEAAGARVLWREPHWVTMADPEGNEFCVFAPPAR